MADTDDHIELFPAMEREAVLHKTPGGQPVVRIEDCTGASIEVYPFEIKLLADWLRRKEPETVESLSAKLETLNAEIAEARRELEKFLESAKASPLDPHAESN